MAEETGREEAEGELTGFGDLDKILSGTDDAALALAVGAAPSLMVMVEEGDHANPIASAANVVDFYNEVKRLLAEKAP